ncbi:fasciculation and elongation protein zeta-2-like [Ostrea edulis]|uniref:fasciculation and elongation protein zeta-2-like n=1 Tax=Ostrea edulis TaxID=37623 RepID=UPI002094BA50|nr:fasciculation and elongation protein zeta-2-like [Ostrea edulis]
MAELQFEAPLAKFENEEWSEYSEFQEAVKVENILKETEEHQTSEINDNEESEHFTEPYSGSLEDLVNSFDEKITKCFCNFEENVNDKIAPVQIRTQEEIINDCQMWWTITGNFGNILPIDWSKSYARQLQSKVLNLKENQEQESPNLDLSDDEELAQQFDMHSLIVSSVHTHDSDHVATADEVISEIENMMQENVPPEYCQDDLQHEMALEKEKLPQIPTYTEADLKGMNCTQLNEVLNEYEVIIKELSEVLIRELALRDEREYDKELKNQFISLLLTIQKRRREGNLDKKKKKNKSVNNNMNSPDSSSTFLTTVIPYHAVDGPPTSEQLQIYIKILQAINEDSPTVPSLLTDYILKVLCPT